MSSSRSKGKRHGKAPQREPSPPPDRRSDPSTIFEVSDEEYETRSQREARDFEQARKESQALYQAEMAKRERERTGQSGPGSSRQAAAQSPKPELGAWPKSLGKHSDIAYESELRRHVSKLSTTDKKGLHKTLDKRKISRPILTSRSDFFDADLVDFAWMSKQPPTVIPPAQPEPAREQQAARALPATPRAHWQESESIPPPKAYERHTSRHSRVPLSSSHAQAATEALGNLRTSRQSRLPMRSIPPPEQEADSPEGIIEIQLASPRRQSFGIRQPAAPKTPPPQQSRKQYQRSPPSQGSMSGRANVPPDIDHRQYMPSPPSSPPRPTTAGSVQRPVTASGPGVGRGSSTYDRIPAHLDYDPNLPLTIRPPDSFWLPEDRRVSTRLKKSATGLRDMFHRRTASGGDDDDAPGGGAAGVLRSRSKRAREDKNKAKRSR